MSAATVHQIAADLANGNISDAKRRAKRVPYAELQIGFFSVVGWSMSHATAAAIYLKKPSPETWQRYCDASASGRATP